LPPRRQFGRKESDEGATMNSTKEREVKLETNHVASGSFPIMTAVVKKPVGNKSVQKASYSSRKTAFPLFRIGRDSKNPTKTA
jgi:hypothetical protein